MYINYFEKDQISIDAVAVLRISYLQMLSLQPEITAVQPSEVKKTFLAITSSLGWLSNWHRPSLLTPKAKWSWKIISTNPLEQYFISNGKVRAVERTFLCHLMSLHKVLQNHTLHEYILIYLLKVFTSYRSQRF